jgi:hypothetical protein
MANLSVKLEPFEIPEFVIAMVGSEPVQVPIEDLDEETLAELLEEFSAAVLAKVAK